MAGRGEMSLSILIETMRREGYEFQVSPPRVLYQEIDGVKCEPMERLVVDVPADAVGAVIELSLIHIWARRPWPRQFSSHHPATDTGSRAKRNV